MTVTVEYWGGPNDGQVTEEGSGFASAPIVINDEQGVPIGFYRCAKDGKRIWCQDKPAWLG